jgi:predicted anti-sigma-YlaC factor YlaD
MHRLIRDHLEEVLAESTPETAGQHQSHKQLPEAQRLQEAHVRQCEECSSELDAMREQAALLRKLRTPDSEDPEPRPGFYARVMERIEAQGAASIWNIFFESPFGRRIAAASMALALLLGIYLYTSEQFADTAHGSGQTVEAIAGEDQPGMVLTQEGMPDRDSVLVNLVTYREQ